MANQNFTTASNQPSIRLREIAQRTLFTQALVAATRDESLVAQRTDMAILISDSMSRDISALATQLKLAFGSTKCLTPRQREGIEIMLATFAAVSATAVLATPRMLKVWQKCPNYV